MSKRAEERAFEHYAPSTNPKNESIRRKKLWAYALGYEQAEKDMIERAMEWLSSNVRDYLYCCTELGTSGIDSQFFQDFKRAMEEE